jgi:hypothetical protein
MFATYKHSKASGYNKIQKGGQTNGGGWYWTPSGGGFRDDNCGAPCSFDQGEKSPDYRYTLKIDYTNSNGYCAFSYSDACARQGYCVLQTQNATGVAKLEAPYQSNTLSASLFAKQTCLDGFSSTEGNSENPYTKTAELACVTSINSGKDIPGIGAFGTTTKDCVYLTPQNPLSLYADGPNFPAVLDSNATGSWCGGRDGDKKCIATETCSGCVIVVPTYYDNCGKADSPDGGPLFSWKTADPCPIYDYPDCESAYILSKTGNYITTGSKNIDSFKTVTVYALSTDKAVEFSMTSGSASPEINQTFTYDNAEVKYTGLKGKESSYTNSYVWLGESGASTSTYKVGAGGYQGGGDPVTLFYSTEVKCTSEGIAYTETGPGANPCCLDLDQGTSCSSEGVTEKTTDTVLAGSSFLFTHSKISTVAVGDYVAYQATSIERKDHLAWGEFGYSTSNGSSWNSNANSVDKYDCVSFSSPIVSMHLQAVCVTCAGGNVARAIAVKGPPLTNSCAMNCGCTSTKGETTAPGPNIPGQTQCYDSGANCNECTQVFNDGREDGDPNFTYTDCCERGVPEYGWPVYRTENEQIERQGDCAQVGQVSYEVSYNHVTRAQTLTTGIAFEDGGFQVTLQKDEGLYFWDYSKKSMQTATSFSLKQSNSDIENSHATFAFDGAYYNPMGRTTQFGSDGAKKTFIALATGDAVYLVGSPNGKSKGTATASHDGDVHSYYISDPTAKIWNQASWPGHGVVNGKITTGTFSYSFNTGAFKNSYGAEGSLARFLAGAKQTIVAHGGLNVISSKEKVSESFETTFSTKAFSTSFDSTFKGAWIAKAIPYTYIATKSVGWNTWNQGQVMPVETDHVFSVNCSGCDFPQPGIPIPLIGDTATYFNKGDKSLIYNKNAASYLWTHPAFKKKWGDGHAGECYAGE